MYKIFPVAKNELGDFREYFDDPREQNHETWDIIITNIFLKNTPTILLLLLTRKLNSGIITFLEGVTFSFWLPKCFCENQQLWVPQIQSLL